MAREKGTVSFSANFEAQKAAPIDARMLVDTKADLISPTTWTANDGSIYAYLGMVVSVHSDSTPANNGVYQLTTLPYTIAGNWIQLGSGSSDHSTLTNLTYATSGHIGFQSALTFGIENTNAVQITTSGVAENDYAKFSPSGLVGRSYSEVLSDIGAQASLGFTPEDVANKRTTFQVIPDDTHYISEKLAYDQLALKANDNSVIHTSGNETVNGIKTFSSIPLSSGVPSTDYQVANKKYVDDSVGAENLWDRTETTLYPHTLNDNINIGSGTAIVGEVDFNINRDNPTHSEGKVFYDNIKHALSYYNEEADITVNIGQEVLIRVKNETGSTIPNGSVVYPSGFSGGEILIGLAIASDKEKCRLIGVVTHDIIDDSTGYVTKIGEVGDLDTSGYDSGDVIYLSPTVPGGTTKTIPIGAHYITRIGAVKIQSATVGSIVVDISTSEQTVEATQDVGFSRTDDCTISVADSATGVTLTLTPVGVDYCFYQYGDKYCKTIDSIVLPDEEGLFAIYYNLGTLTYVKNPTNSQIEVVIKNNPIVAYIYWNATDKKSEYVGYELHGINMSSVTHAYLHFAFGARYMNGLAPNSIVVDGNGDIDASAQFGVDAGAISDEDIYLAYAGIDSTVGLPIAYLSGTDTNPTLRVTSNAGFSVLTTGTGRMAYNTLSGGNYILSEVSNADFALCHIIAVNENNASKRLVAFIGQAQYTTLTNARAGAQTEIKNLRVVGILPQEAKAIATFVFETADNFDNGVKSRVRLISTGVNYVDWRTTYLNGSSSGSTGGTNSTIFDDSLFKIIDNGDATKAVQFDCAGITTGNTRVLIVPDSGGVVALVQEPVSAIGLNAKSDADKITDIITVLRTHNILGPNS